MLTRCCRLVLLPKRVFYYKAKDRGDQLFRMGMSEVAATRVRYGFWRIYILLIREGFMDNHKRVYRVYCEQGLNLCSKPPRRSRCATHRHPKTGDCSTLHWSMDFVSDQLYDGCRFRMLTVVDTYSRKCLAITPGQSLKGDNVVAVMKRLIFEQGQAPKRIKVDNGSEFSSKALDKWVYEHDVELDFSRPGKPTDNAFIERFNVSLRDECLNINWFLSIEDAREKLEAWKEDYNNFRPHSSLGGMPPNEYIQTRKNSPDSLLLNST